MRLTFVCTMLKVVLICAPIFIFGLACQGRDASPALSTERNSASEQGGVLLPDSAYEAEEQFVHEALNEAQDDSTEVWAEGDMQFYSRWQQGLEQESAGSFVEAAESYRQALNVNRYEMPSYEALLPLGRALLRNGQARAAQDTLIQYIHEAEAELTGEAEALWGLSDEGHRRLEHRVRYARQLLAQADTIR